MHKIQSNRDTCNTFPLIVNCIGTRSEHIFRDKKKTLKNTCLSKFMI